MLVTLFGISTEVRPVQLEKAEEPMLVTLFGIVTEVRLVQPENAPSPMLVTLLGITVFLQPTISVFVAVSMIALQPFRESYSILPERTVIEVSPEQPEKAEEPMLVTRNLYRGDTRAARESRRADGNYSIYLSRINSIGNDYISRIAICESGHFSC